jgi:probable F420-dependent oxidoreductase
MAIKFGTTYPTMDLGTDPVVLRDWAQGLESIGFDEIYIPEHVVGIDVSQRPDWRPLDPNTLRPGPPLYGHTTPFLEPCVAMGYLAGVTTSITLTSGILVLPQRQTALVAKQLAIADILSGGRVRLGIGAGWSDAEFAALGSDYSTRGRRMDEQITVLRKLWTEESVTYSGRFHSLDAVGICPLPVQRPIPILVGGDSDAARKRAVTIGDGWFVTSPLASIQDRIELFWQEAAAAGRSAALTLTGTVYLGPREPEELAADVAAWETAGATHLNLRTSSYPVQWKDGKMIRKSDVDQHIDALSRIKKSVKSVNSTVD